MGSQWQTILAGAPEGYTGRRGRGARLGPSSMSTVGGETGQDTRSRSVAGKFAAEIRPLTTILLPASRGPTAEDVPELRAGDRLTRAEFERRYAAMPHLKKAELIEGVWPPAAPVMTCTTSCGPIAATQSANTWYGVCGTGRSTDSCCAKTATNILRPMSKGSTRARSFRASGSIPRRSSAAIWPKSSRCSSKASLHPNMPNSRTACRDSGRLRRDPSFHSRVAASRRVTSQASASPRQRSLWRPAGGDTAARPSCVLSLDNLPRVGRCTVRRASRPSTATC